MIKPQSQRIPQKNLRYPSSKSQRNGRSYRFVGDPQGGIDMIRKIIKIDEAKCNGCGECADVCPTGCIKKVDFVKKIAETKNPR